MKQFSCGDIIPGCRTFQANDGQAILTAVAAHAAAAHGLHDLPEGLVAQMRSHIYAAA